MAGSPEALWTMPRSNDEGSQRRVSGGQAFCLKKKQQLMVANVCRTVRKKSQD